jgi:hypothetical protein
VPDIILGIKDATGSKTDKVLDSLVEFILYSWKGQKANTNR